MKHYFQYIFFVFLMLFVFQNKMYAQKDKVSLQKKYNTILTDIKGIENLIEQNESQKKKSINQLQSLNAKINSRENLIGNISAQIAAIDKNINKNKQITQSMENDIEALKKDYAQMIYHSYKNLNTSSTLSFLLASESFNQAIRRLNYLRSYAKYRKNQAAVIKETIAGIKVKVERLEEEKAEKEKLLEEEELQKNTLVTEKIEKNTLVSKLKGDSKSLKSQVKEKNNAAEDLNNQIQKIIQEEIRAAEAKAKREAAKNTAAGDAYVKKELNLSKDFVSNKGKLPWPVEKGHIIEKFGTHAHPTLSKVTVDNNGIDIRTEANQAVRSIFEGEVVNTFYLPTNQNTIIIKHGEYFTVYSRLKSISVDIGDKVSTNQKLGVAYTSATEKITTVHLEIWKSINKLNPQDWIKSVL